MVDRHRNQSGHGLGGGLRVPYGRRAGCSQSSHEEFLTDCGGNGKVREDKVYRARQG